jgi:hypothetical protein
MKLSAKGAKHLIERKVSSPRWHRCAEELPVERDK